MPALPLYVFANLLFGLNGIIASMIPFESGVIVLIRLVLGGLFLAVLLAASRKLACRRGQEPQAMSTRQRLLLIISGLAMGASWLGLYAGFQLIGVGITTLLYYTGPILLMLFLAVTGQDRFSVRQWGGLCAAAVGAFLAVGSVGSRGTLSVPGVAAGLFSACGYAAMVWFARRAGEADGLTAAVTEIGAAFPMVLLYVLLTGAGLPDAAALASAWLPALTLGVVNTGVGCALYFYAVSRLSASVVSSAGYLEPISALIFAAVFLGEALGFIGWTGAALVMAGTLMAAKR